MISALLRAIKRLDAAEANIKAVATIEQKRCKHKEVLQLPWRSSEYFSPSKGRRICIDCGLEQEGSSYGDQDYHYSRLKTKGFHKEVSSEEFYKHRLPCTEINSP